MKIVIFLTFMCLLSPGLVLGDELVILTPKGGDFGQGGPLTIKWDYTILSRSIPATPSQRRVYFKVGSPSNPAVTPSDYDFSADITAQQHTWTINKVPGTYAVHCLVAFTDPPVKVSSLPFRVLVGLTSTVSNEGLTATTSNEVLTTMPSNDGLTTTPSSPSGQIKKVPKAMLNRIQVFSPETGKTYYIGSKVLIRWKTDNIKKYSYVNIQAHWPNGQSAAGSYPAPNTGSYEWTVNETKEVSFYLKFFTQDNEFKGQSGVFHVKFPLKLDLKSKKPVQVK